MSTDTSQGLVEHEWVQRGRDGLSEHWLAYLLVLPTMLALLLILWLPFTRGIWMSLHEWPVVGERTFIGFDNYEFLLGWDTFYISIKATIIYGLSTVLQLVIALVAALLIVNQKWFKNFTSSLFLLPYTLPPVVSGTVWLYLLDPNFGPILTALTDYGLLENGLFWRSSGDLAITVITLVGAWTFWPFMFIIILATLQSIPEEHYEAAKIYGANRVQRFLKVTLPQLKSAIIVAVTLRTIWNLSKVAQPLQMTGGGPGYDTSVLGILLYRFASDNGRMGLSFAVGIFLLLLTSVFIVVFIRENRRSQQTELK
ncbi:carbohydrate ABC transporter permease [Halobellus captivus]|uniref:carbohydrate ABC transporter permease n=1 Tax=Halobellus captivus TaxID=2592614 RepID=UPI0011A3DE07|nr:sugar ABC transporter permease [Halobellus captivus]